MKRENKNQGSLTKLGDSSLQFFFLYFSLRGAALDYNVIHPQTKQGDRCLDGKGLHNAGIRARETGLIIAIIGDSTALFNLNVRGMPGQGDRNRRIAFLHDWPRGISVVAERGRATCWEPGFVRMFPERDRGFHRELGIGRRVWVICNRRCCAAAAMPS